MSSRWLRVASQGRRSPAGVVSAASAAAAGASTPRLGQADQDQVGAEAAGQCPGAVALTVQRPANPMVRDRRQRAAVVEADRRGQTPFVLVGPIDGHHVLTSSAEGLLAGPASQVGDGEPGRVGHRLTAMPIRQDRGSRPPDDRAGPAA
jgi:hypothetical protein